MDLFNLVAKLTLDSSEYDRAMAAAKGTATSAGDSMVKSIGKTKKAIGVAAVGMAAAIGAFGVSSVKTGMEFDSSMSQVAATMGYSVAEINDKTSEAGQTFDKLRNFAQQMGQSTKFSATESADALNYMALAGYDAEKSMRMLPNVLNLAAAGSIDLAAASDMVTDASSALGLSEKETTKMIDQMAAASSKSNTSVEQLGQAILTVGGTAKVLKGGTTELSTALGILADNGTKGAEGGTALRNVLTSIQGGKFEKTFGEMGVQAYDAQGNLRSLKDIFLDMGDAMEGMTDEEKTDIINKTFNARDLKNVNALLGTSAERWDELTGAIENSKDAASNMAETQMDNLAGDITLLQSAFEGLKISVSDQLTPAFRGIVQFLTWCIDHASTLGPIILGLATAFGVFAVAINIGTIIQNVTKAFAAFNAILAANPIALVIALIAGLVVAFVTLYKNNEKFRNIVNSVWNAVKTKVVGAVGAIKSAFGTLGSAVATVKKTFDSIKSAISEKIDAAKKKVEDVVKKIKGLFPLSIGKIFSSLKLPHFSVSGGQAPFGIAGKGSPPSFNVTWYKKAMEQPYLFTMPTMFDARVAGDAGDEMLYGRNALMRDIKEATSDAKSGDVFNFNLYYTGDNDANDMLKDVARGVRRYRMAGAI